MGSFHHPAKRLAFHKSLLTLGISVGVVTLGYEIHSINRRFSNLLSYAAIEKEKEKNSCYVGVPHSTGEVEINDVISKLLIAQEAVETMIRGPKSVASSNNPWQLLRLLKSEMHTHKHQQALNKLATGNYNVGLCQQIAQACDLKTAVRLARTEGVNLNLFLQPPPFLTTAPPESLVDDLSKLLSVNPPSEKHKCASHFLAVAQHLVDKEKDEEYVLGWDVDTGRISHPENTILIIRLYLQAVLQQSECYETSKTMVQQGLLTILWRVVHAFPNEVGLSTLCTQIVANLSSHPPLLVHIFQSGWIGLLAEFLRSREHLALSLAAGKALANMDETSRKYGVYDSSTYLLHPLHSTSATTAPSTGVVGWDVDVIFVHGLLGGVAWTWRQSEVLGLNASEYSPCWPKDWLPRDVPGLRVLGIDYTTSLSHWRSRCPEERSSMSSKADEVLQSLKRAGVGRRPIVWVGHSMGGLLLEQLLVKASKSSDPALTDVVDKTKAVMLLSVPHSGSPVATLNATARFLLLPSVEVDELRKDSKVLQSLNGDFKKLLNEHQMAIVSVIETKATPVKPWRLELKFVEPSSADLCWGEVHYIPVDHFEICKPVNRNSFVYQRLVKLLRGVREGSALRDLIQSRPTSVE